MKKFGNFLYFLPLAAALQFCATSALADTKYEAESATQSKCEIVSGDKYSEGKAVKMTDAKASLTFDVSVETSAKYKLFIAAEGIGGEKSVYCSVNGANMTFKCEAYGEVEVGTFSLKETGNTISITPFWTWYNIDYIRIEAAESSITFDIASRPVNANATESALKLYAFLAENFGDRTISGIMTGNMDGSDGKSVKAHEDVQAVYKASGYYPALVGFDFMNGTGVETDKSNSWFKEYNDKVLSLAKDVWNQGGIPDFSWHWRDPSRTTGEFYSKDAKLNFTTAMNADGSWNTGSALYKNLIKDIDIVAGYFLSLQEDGVACIFRPLHEANGGWFWWGTQGAEAYKKLFQLVYDEMVNVKGVNNVIWDWNADFNLGTEWCPGAEYYDIVSTDIYNNANDHSSNYPAFDKLKEATEGKKIIALAENGPIPDIELMADDEAMWSWWMPWYQSWDGKFVDKTSKDEWKKCMSDTRVITLEDMPGWDNYSSVDTLNSVSPATSVTFNLFGISCQNAGKGDIFIKDGKKMIIK